MEKWEYIAIYFYEGQEKDNSGKKRNGWWLKFNDGSAIEGINNILNHYGSFGWELINIITECTEGWQNSSAGTKSLGYRAFFKRKLQS